LGCHPVAVRRNEHYIRRKYWYTVVPLLIVIKPITIPLVFFATELDFNTRHRDWSLAIADILFIFVSYNCVRELFRCAVPKKVVQGHIETTYCSGILNQDYQLCICVISRESYSNLISTFSDRLYHKNIMTKKNKICKYNK
jgi:hypothetical protein